MHGSNMDGNRLQAFSPEQALDYLADLACRSLSAAHTVLWIKDSDTQVLKSRPGSASAAASGLNTHLRCLSRRVQQANQTLMIENAEPHTSDPLGQAAIPSAILGAPIRNGLGQAVGSLCVVEQGARPWNQKDLSLLVELAEAASAQVDRAKQATFGCSDVERHRSPEDVPGLIFERRKVDGDGWTYTFFGASRQVLSDVNGRSGHDDSLDFVHADDRDRVRDTLRRAVTEEVDVDVTFRVPTPTGAARWLRSQSVVRHEQDGAAVWDGLCYDISDLVAAREAAESARVATDMLLADVNHELRTPLQSILGFTELLKSETRTDVVRSHAALIETSAQSLLSIVNQLLDLASGDEGASRLVKREPFDIRSLAESCHRMVAPLAAEKGIALSYLVEADVPPCVLADGPKIRQVLVNLLNNAIKFTEVGSIRLHVARGATGLRCSVTDTGIGVAEDKVALLFQRFFRLEPSPRSARGTGLGLAIAKQLVEAMNGEIGVASTLGQGTTFWFELPARAVAAPAGDPHAESEAQPEVRDGARILLADDLDLNRKLIADMLSVEGYEVDCVGDGEAALRAARDHPYDLILMDMIMPVMDGIAATRAIRTLPAPACEVPIIALTAHTFREQLDSCLAAGMNATLTKPMSLDTLINAVKDWTQNRSQAA